jgi:hypothetical protein
MFGLLNINNIDTDIIENLSEKYVQPYTKIYDQATYEARKIFRKEMKKNPLYFFYGNPGQEAVRVIQRFYSIKGKNTSNNQNYILPQKGNQSLEEKITRA